MMIPRIDPLVPYSEVIEGLPDDEFVRVEGQPVFVRDVGSGPAIVLLHGFASTSWSFRELFGSLKSDYHLLAIDLNGFGYTQRPGEKSAYRLENQADLIAKVLAAKNIEEAVLVGHSYGAGVAATIQSRHPQLVSRLVLISPPVTVGEKPPWYLRNGLAARILYWMVRGLLSNPEKFREISGRAIYVEGVLTNDLSERYRKSMLVEGLKDAFSGYTEALAGGDGDLIPYREVSVESLIIAGEKDAIVPVEDVKSIATKIPHSRLEVIPECGHCSPEERPQEVIRLIRGFLEIGEEETRSNLRLS